MAYVDREFYVENFKGDNIAEEEFDRLADIASEVIYDVCILKPDLVVVSSADFKKAVCYEIEMIYSQGGVDAILGFSETAMSGGSEHLGDYSISSGSGMKDAVKTLDGIPVSPMAIIILRRLGLMRAWAYAPFYDERINKDGD